MPFSLPPNTAGFGALMNALQLRGLAVDTAAQNLQIGQQFMQQNEIDLQMKRQQMELSNQYREQALKSLTMDPTRANPNTQSISDTADANLIPEEKVLRDLRSEKDKANRDLLLAQAYNLDTRPVVTRLDSLDTNIREATKDAAKRRGEMAQQTAQILRDVNSTPGLMSALDSIATNFGVEAARAVNAKLPHDGKGFPIWNDTAKQMLAPYASQFTTMHEKAMQDYRKAEVQHQADTLAETQRRHREEAHEADVRAAQAVAAEKGRMARAQMVMDRMGGAGYKVTKDSIDQVDKLAKEYRIRDYRKSVEVADSISSKLTDPARGYAEVNPANARALVDQFKLMIDNYRARTGGRYQEAEISRMNGLLQRLDKFTEKIGEGDALLAKDVMLQTTKQMQQLYTDRATDLAKEELQRAQILKKRGGDPTVLPLQTNPGQAADLQDLERRGAAKRVTADGKDYVLFPKPGALTKKKRGPEDFDAFELPSAPEQKMTPIILE